MYRYNAFIDIKQRSLAFLRDRGIYSGGGGSGSAPGVGGAAPPPAESKATV